jgi:2-haloacid dehalogenase
VAEAFTSVGAPAEWATLWFASVLRDGFALTAAGVNPSFSDVAAGVLTAMLAALDDVSDVDAAVAQVMGRFSELPVHPDVADGVRALRAQGLRLVTLSNGASRVAEQLLHRAGLATDFEQRPSVAAAPAWKPAAATYDYAAEQCGTRPERMLLIASHAWDIDGAARADLHTGWLNRTGNAYPAHFRTPDYTAPSLTELADQLA